jgi:hypothetical protein
MADDPNLRHDDGWFVSTQPHEYKYFKSAIQHEFPYKTEDQITTAILVCRNSIAPSEGRKKLIECVRRKLSV